MDDKKVIYLDDAIDAVSKACFELRGIFGQCEDALKALPPAQPERKKGKWIKWEALNGLTYGSICSECGYLSSAVPNYGTKYCPDCGADMRGEDDGE